METIDIINNIVRLSCINVLTYVVFIKIINYNNNFKKTSVIVIFSIVEAFIETMLLQQIKILSKIFIMYIMHSLIIAKVTNNKYQYSIIITFISLTINYLLYIVNVIVASIILKFLIPSIQKENTSILLLGVVLEYFVICRYFKIKRFKSGISF